MHRPYRCTLAARLILAVLLIGLLASCRVNSVETAKPAQTSYPGPPATMTPWPDTPVPSSGPAARPTQATPVAPPPSATAGSAPTPGNVAFTVTILHTGEVHGEVRPCG